MKKDLVENIAFACLTRHCLSGRTEERSIHWIHSDLTQDVYSHNFFETGSNQVAAVLNALGVRNGDVVAVLLPAGVDLANSFYAVLKNLAIACVLFSTLGEEAIFDRMENCRAKVLITKRSQLKKVRSVQSRLPFLKKVLLVDADEHVDSEILSLPLLKKETGDEFSYSHYVDPETPAFLQYTSGSTGKPKGALHVHAALEDMILSFDEVMKPQRGEVYWCTADPAWITGLVYGLIVPFALAISQVHLEGTYNAERWMRVLVEQHVNIWYTAPTALRMLMQEPIGKINRSYDDLKKIYSVGEPLNPEIITWGKKVFHRVIYDTWFQSETGSIMVANRPGMIVKPGSMGLPRPGVEVIICDDEVSAVPDGVQGNLCVRKGWRSMFRTYYARQSAYDEKFVGDIYLTGDLAWKDKDGYIWYVSRADDVINTAGHLVGPFEVESALLELDEIVDVAVIGAPDEMLHQKIVAYITLRPGLQWSRELELKCRVHVANTVSTSAIPADFKMIDRVPKNQSGKILRRVLKALYEGRDPGDISTMEK